MVIINQVIILMLMIVVGLVAKKIGVVSENINKEISSLVINVTLPAFIINAMNQGFDREIFFNSMTLVIISIFVYAGSILFAKVVAKGMRVEGSTKDVFEYVMVFANVGYMGYPVLDVAFGKTGVFYAAVYNLAFNLLVWSYGVYILNRHSTHKEKAKIKIFNPALVSVFIGFTIFLFSIPLPFAVSRTLELVGSVSTPLSMMFIGFILADVHIKELLTEWQSVILSFFRLIFIPLVMLVVLKKIGFSGLLIGVPVLLHAMPAAANTAILASKYESDYYLASKVIFISTFLSIFSIPIILGLINL